MLRIHADRAVLAIERRAHMLAFLLLFILTFHVGSRLVPWEQPVTDFRKLRKPALPEQ